MTTTIYTFHRDEDGEILAHCGPAYLQQCSATVARNLATSGDRRDRIVHVHNGRGFIATGLCRGAEWRDLPRGQNSHQPTRRVVTLARETREQAGWPLD